MVEEQVADKVTAGACVPLRPGPALDAWDQAKRRFAVLLRETAPDAAWAEQFRAAAQGLRTLARCDTDTALFVLLQAAANELDRYSAHHAMLCAVVGDLCVAHFAWPTDEADALWHAALTMNLSITSQQDAMAVQQGPLTPQQREAVDGHAAQSALLLVGAGVDDALWTEVVRRHHEAGTGNAPPDAAARLARLLHRIDVYTAKLSRRATREPASPALAARDACLDASGTPDAIGATMLRMLGLYPPGCFVKLADGEVGIAIRRGERAHAPVVAALRRPDGGLHLQPVRRDTAQRAYAVLHGVQAGMVKVNLNPARVLAAD